MTKSQRINLVAFSLSVSLTSASFLHAAEAPALEKIPEAVPVPTQQSSSPFSTNLSAGYDSDYIFRGLDMGENLVWTGLGLEVPLCDGVQFNAGAWYGTLADTNFGELDLSAGLTYDLGPATVGVGYTYYHFARGMFNARGVSNTSDINGTLVSSYGPVNFAFLYSYNTRTDGHYLELGASTRIPLCENAALVPAASIGYNDEYHRGTSDGFSAVNISLSVPVKITNNAILTPYVAASFALDSLEPINASEDIFYGGVNLAIGF